MQRKHVMHEVSFKSLILIVREQGKIILNSSKGIEISQ